MEEVSVKEVENGKHQMESRFSFGFESAFCRMKIIIFEFERAYDISWQNRERKNELLFVCRFTASFPVAIGVLPLSY